MTEATKPPMRRDTKIAIGVAVGVCVIAVIVGGHMGGGKTARAAAASHSAPKAVTTLAAPTAKPHRAAATPTSQSTAYTPPPGATPEQACRGAIKAQYVPHTVILKGKPGEPAECRSLSTNEVSKIALAVIQANEAG